MAQEDSHEHRPDADEKMVVGLEYSDLPEVVPQPEANQPLAMGGPSAYTPIVSPLSPDQPPSTLRPKAHHPIPWSPASLESLNPRLSTLAGAPPPPYEPSEPPSPSPSQVSHIPLNRPTTSGGYAYSRPGTAQPYGGAVPAMPGMGVSNGVPQMGPIGGLGPVAAARRRRRRRWIICACACGLAVLIVLALGVGIAAGWIHVRWTGNGGTINRRVIPRALGRSARVLNVMD